MSYKLPFTRTAKRLFKRHANKRRRKKPLEDCDYIVDSNKYGSKGL